MGRVSGGVWEPGTVAWGSVAALRAAPQACTPRVSPRAHQGRSALKSEFKAVLTGPRRKGKKSSHLSACLCFLLGSGRAREGEDSCVSWESPERTGSASGRAPAPRGVTLGALGAVLASGPRPQQSPQTCEATGLALNMGTLPEEGRNLLGPLLRQAHGGGATGRVPPGDTGPRWL